MGIVTMNVYTANLVTTLATKVVPAISKSAERVDSGAANAACLRWFGQNDAGFRRGLATRLRQFKTTINLGKITVGFERLGLRDPTTNAGAFPSAGDIRFNQPIAQVPAGHEVVELDMAYELLPNYLTTDAAGDVDVTFYNQSRFETLVHELSHALLATADEDWNGHEAYGAKRASRLAANIPALAQTNAENWGIFVEAVGLNLAQ